MFRRPFSLPCCISLSLILQVFFVLLPEGLANSKSRETSYIFWVVELLFIDDIGCNGLFWGGLFI